MWREVCMACGLAGAGLLGCGPRAVDGPAEASPPSMTLFGAESLEFQGAVLKAHGFAKTVYYRRDSGDARASQARVQLTGRRHVTGGRIAGDVWIDAPVAEGNPLAQSVTGSGGVTLRSESGDRGDTERASYRGQEALASGDRPVTLVGPGYRLSAPGFKLDTLTDRLTLEPAELTTRGVAP